MYGLYRIGDPEEAGEAATPRHPGRLGESKESKMRNNFRRFWAQRICVGLLGVAAAAAQAQSSAAAPPSSHAPATTASSDSATLQQELVKLREQVARLEQRLGQPGASPSASSMPKKAKAPMTSMPMESDDDMDMPMGAMPPDTAMPKQPMGMDMMKRMDKMKMGNNGMMGMAAMGGANSPAMSMPSALPGFPGQSHLYHIGATGFFLDHPEHIVLTTQQKQALAKKKQQSLLKQGEIQRQIDAAEQEMWELTGADQPQAADIDRKAREIERLRAEQRIAFVRAVGESAKILTEEQREQLTGTSPSQAMPAPAPMSMPDEPAKPDKMGHM
jgi:Spy/CpxP family protein refolding chaperone